MSISDLKNRVAAAFLQRSQDTELYPEGIGAEPQQAESSHFHHHGSGGFRAYVLQMHCLLLVSSRVFPTPSACYFVAHSSMFRHLILSAVLPDSRMREKVKTFISLFLCYNRPQCTHRRR